MTSEPDHATVREVIGAVEAFSTPFHPGLAVLPVMKITVRTEYACVAMAELAAHYGSGEPLSIREIAERHGVPARFLVHIVLQLKEAGLVAATRGGPGKYSCGRSPLAEHPAGLSCPCEPQ